jgi:hypothetical protein
LEPTIQAFTCRAGEGNDLELRINLEGVLPKSFHVKIKMGGQYPTEVRKDPERCERLKGMVFVLATIPERRQFT